MRVCVCVRALCDHRVTFDRHLCLGAAQFDHQRTLMVQLCVRVGLILCKSQKHSDLTVRVLTPQPNVFLVKGAAFLVFFLQAT